MVGSYVFHRFHGSNGTASMEPMEPNRGTPGTVELRNGAVRYRLVPVHVPEQLPPENVPFIDRRSEESVALNV